MTATTYPDIDLLINKRDTHAWIYLSKLDASQSEVISRLRSLDRKIPTKVIIERQPSGDDLKKWALLFSGFDELGASISFTSNKIEAGKIPCDPTFLKELPPLRHLNLNYAWNVRSLDFLQDHSTLETLDLEGVNPSGKNLSVLAELPKLKELQILKITKGIEVLADCKELEKLTLHSISTDNLSFLEGHPRLWWLSVVLGGIKNFDALTKTKLKYLELYQVRDLADLGFISSMPTLESLQLAQLKDAKRLPNFSKLKKLRRIKLNQMKGIVDLSPLLSSKELEDLIVEDFGHLEPNDFGVLTKHSKLKRGVIGLGSTRKNETVAKLIPLDNKFGLFNYSDGTKE